MPKLAGCILIIGGCIGFAGSVCREIAERLLRSSFSSPEEKLSMTVL